MGDIAGNKNARGYIELSVEGETILAHQLALLLKTGTIPLEIDHINKIKTDNKIRNLRSITKSGNAINSNVRSTNKSGITGICKDKVNNKWIVQIHSKVNKNEFLGRFEDFFEACCMRKSAEIKYNYLKIVQGYKNIK